MSNTDRPRTGLKPCPFDGATTRDSNGQCHCRNVLYRLTSKIDDPAAKASVAKKYDKALKDGKTVEEARALVAPAKKAPAEPKAPAKKAAAKKATTKKATAKKAAEAPQSPTSDPEAQPEAPATEEPQEAESVAPRDDTDPEWETAAPDDEPVVHAVRKTAVGVECECGFEGKGNLASIRAHVARENRNARVAAEA